MTIRYRRLAIAVLTAAILSPASSYAATLNGVLDKMADELVQYMDTKGKKDIMIGDFKIPRSGGGRRIGADLSDLLKKKSVSVVSDELSADWVLSGSLSMNTQGKRALVVVEAELNDAETGAEIKVFRERFNEATEDERETANVVNGVKNPVESGAVVDDQKDVAEIAGVNVDNQESVKKATNIDATAKVQPKDVAANSSGARAAVSTALKDAINNRSFHLVNQTKTVVAASQTSPFHMEVRASNEAGEFVPVPVTNVKGLAFLSLLEGQLYDIKVYNTAEFDIGLELSIDGINTLRFSENPTFVAHGKWVIPRGRTGLIRGWFRNAGPNGIDKFKIVAEPEGVAAELGKPQRIGTITGAFYPAWSPGEEPPAFQQLLAGTDKGATGRGPADDFRGTIVDRQFGTKPLALVSLTYQNPEPPSDLPDEPK